MEMRNFGRSGLQLSVLGFGCGAVGGLMVRGDPAEQERSVAHALEAGVNYFDTAALYGDGESERNLGRLLKKLKPANAIIGTKVRLTTSDLGQVSAGVSSSLEASLQRLGLDRVDLFYLHDPITVTETAESLSSRQVLPHSLQATRPKTTGVCSTTPRQQELVLWAFVCWRVEHCPGRRSAIQ